jgi:hypothetical protein
MIIRRATIDDLPDILDAGSEMFSLSVIARRASLDRSTCEAMFRNIIGSDNGLVLLAYKDDKLLGGIAACLTPLWYNADEKVAVALAWWVFPEHRGSRAGGLLKAGFEDWALAKSAAMTAISSVMRDGNPDLSEMLERDGYALSEKLFTKEM